MPGTLKLKIYGSRSCSDEIFIAMKLFKIIFWSKNRIKCIKFLALPFDGVLFSLSDPLSALESPSEDWADFFLQRSKIKHMDWLDHHFYIL